MKRAAWLLGTAAAEIAAAAWLLSAAWHLSYGHAVYCALGTATTVGCDAGPHDPAGRIAASVVMLTLIPSLAAVFAWLTGRHAAGRMRERLEAAEKRIAEEADRRHVIMQRHVERLLKGHCADLKQHVSVVAGGLASGGAGDGPAASGGLPAETGAAATAAPGPGIPPPAIPPEPGGT